MLISAWEQTMEFHLIVRQLLTKCLITTFIFNIAVVTNQVAVSQLTVIPQWNVTSKQTDADSCSLGTNSTQEDAIILTGSVMQSCSVQLTTSYGAAVLIENPKGVLLYAERKGNLSDCQKKMYLSQQMSTVYLCLDKQFYTYIFKGAVAMTVASSSIICL